MFKHIVLFKLHEEAEGASKAENAIKIKKLLEGLPAKIPMIREYEVGINIIESERAYDISLISTFNGMEDLNGYLEHSEHKKAGEYISKLRQSSVSCDYEF